MEIQRLLIGQIESWKENCLSVFSIGGSVC
jgi:hypothetical protein